MSYPGPDSQNAFEEAYRLYWASRRQRLRWWKHAREYLSLRRLLRLASHYPRLPMSNDTRNRNATTPPQFKY